MKKTVGILLILIGIIMIAYSGFKHPTTEKNHTIQWPAIVGLVLIVGGIPVIALEKKSIPS